MTPYFPFYLFMMIALAKKAHNLVKAIRAKDDSWMKAAAFEIGLVVVVSFPFIWYFASVDRG